MRFPSLFRPVLAILAVVAAACPNARAAEHITLRNGSESDCARHVNRWVVASASTCFLSATRVQMPPARAWASSDSDYIEISAESVLRVDPISDLPVPPAVAAAPLATPVANRIPLTSSGIRSMLDRAGALHDIDADLLASVIHAEQWQCACRPFRAGAQGLMQLMPSTASDLGVSDSCAGAEHRRVTLDVLLRRYHNDMRLAVAAYNAGLGSGRSLPRHPALRRDLRLRGPRHQRVQSP